MKGVYSVGSVGFSVGSVCNLVVNNNYLSYLGFRQRGCNGVGYGNILRRSLNQLGNVTFVVRMSREVIQVQSPSPTT